MTILQEIILILEEERELERLQKMLDMEVEGQTYRQDSHIENHTGAL